MLPQGAGELDVAAGRDPDLDPAVAFDQMRLNGPEQLDDRGVIPHRQARLNPQGGLSVVGPQKLGDGRIASLAEQVPKGGLGAGGGRPPHAPRTGDLGDPPRRLDGLAEQAGGDRTGQFVPASLDRSARLSERRRALSVGDAARGLDGHDDRVFDPGLARVAGAGLLEGNL